MEHGRDSPLHIDVRWDGAVATVTVTGDLDITTAAALTRRLLAVAAGHRRGLSWICTSWPLSMSPVRGSWTTSTRSCKPCAR